MSDFHIEPLGGQDRSGFSCGSAALDRYFREQVTQDIRRGFANCFVAISSDGGVAGFYTLAATSLGLDAISPARAKKLPRYATIPAVLLGRLAVALEHQGKRLGATLVVDAVERATRSEIAAYAVLVDPKDDAATRFYERLGFEHLVNSRNLMKPLIRL